MKKIISLILAFGAIFALSSCGDTATGGQQSNQGSTNTTETTTARDNAPQTDALGTESGGKALVVYFSATGNTESVAEEIAAAAGADIYEIVPALPYTDEDLNYSNRQSRSTVEQNNENARPEISGTIENISDYDIIYVGYPIWWGDMPRILYTFFDSYDLSGKTIAPFCTSGGSGLSGTPRTIEGLESAATVTDGLHINDSSISGSRSDVEEWLADLGL